MWQAGSDIIALRRTGTPGLCGFGLPPPPTADFGCVLAVLVDILLVVDQRVADRLFGIGRTRAQLRNAVYHISHQMEAVEIGTHTHVEGGGGCPLFLVPALMQILMVGAPVCEPVNQPGVSMKCKYDRLIGSE